MTYRELAEKIATLSEEQKDSDLTVSTQDEEYFGNITLEFCVDGVLDDNHPYLCVTP